MHLPFPQGFVRSMSIESLVDRINDLPSLSPVLARMNAIVASSEASAFEIVDALKLDPAISTKVLRLANSAYVGIPRTVSSLHNAVVILGQRRIHSLVLSASALSSFPRAGPMPFSNMDFWRHSITVALVCESIAKHLKRYDAVEA
ncbi:MAG: HDOD domain-containing protein, partial [Chitinivibrionales bacterium]|nr:HDOD domain-containing protein [Chitinivibrionales bacterium]MBD3396975.1 HDOD domain-containing protein [Chitinivibrionales bacterium]